MYTSANSFERVACILYSFSIIVASAMKATASCIFRQRIFPCQFRKGDMTFCVFTGGQKYGILPSFKVKLKKISKTCADRFKSSVKLLP